MLHVNTSRQSHRNTRNKQGEARGVVVSRSDRLVLGLPCDLLRWGAITHQINDQSTEVLWNPLVMSYIYELIPALSSQTFKEPAWCLLEVSETPTLSHLLSNYQAVGNSRVRAWKNYSQWVQQAPHQIQNNASNDPLTWHAYVKTLSFWTVSVTLTWGDLL